MIKSRTGLARPLRWPVLKLGRRVRLYGFRHGPQISEFRGIRRKKIQLENRVRRLRQVSLRIVNSDRVWTEVNGVDGVEGTDPGGYGQPIQRLQDDWRASRIERLSLCRFQEDSCLSPPLPPPLVFLANDFSFILRRADQLIRIFSREIELS